MDPVANLNEQLETAKKILADEDNTNYEANFLAELVLALDEWRRKGGYDPYTTNQGD